jgi:DNA polymerase-3 subunit delta'
VGVMILSQNNWESLSVYQNQVSRILKNSFSNQCLAHSYIFEGPIGTKRFETAKLFASTLLCTNLSDSYNPCGVCHNCIRVENESHPNLFVIRRDGEKIKKKQMKDLLIEFSKSSVEVGPRIYIIDEAERLNVESANTLLKTMEEPGAEIYQIIVTDQVNSLLKTIVSRAQVIHFKPIDKRLIEADLINKGVDVLYAESIPEYTNNYEEAEKIAFNEEMTSLILFVKEIYLSLSLQKGSIILMFKEKRDLFINDALLTDFVLSMMILFQKDILGYKLRHIDQLVFKDQTEILEKCSKRMSQAWIEQVLDEMLGLKLKLKYNINSQFAFDKVLLTLERGYIDGISSRSNSI